MQSLAWRVHTESQEIIVFASDMPTAFEIGSTKLGDAPCVVHRDERFDQYSPGPVPAKKLVQEHGWALECECCGNGVWKEKSEVQGKTPVFAGSLAFCSKQCQKKHFEKEENYCDEVEKAVETVLTRCPDAEIIKSWGVEDDFGTLEVFVSFKIPGGVDQAIWRSSNPAIIRLSMCDNETWLDYKKSKRVH